MLTPEDVRKVEFQKVVIGGYKQIDVDYFLDEVAGTIEALEKKNAELIKKLEDK